MFFHIAAVFLSILVLVSAPQSAEAQRAAGGKMERKVLTQTPLAGQPNTIVIVARLTAYPGAALPKHTHFGDEFLYVLQGGKVRLGNGKIQNLPTGASVHFPRGKVHGGFVVVGDKPIRSLTTHIVDKGKPLVSLVK